MVLFWTFMVYSFLGYLLEKLFAAATKSPHQVRKCRLLLPFCPVYGFAMAAVVSLPSPLLATAVRVWLFGGLTVTAVEFIVHLFYEKVLGVRFWDYTGTKFHIEGRVCLSFSLIWGGLVVGAVYGVQPWVELLAETAPPALTYGLLLLAAADAVFSCRVLWWGGNVDWMSIPVLLRALQGEK